MKILALILILALTGCMKARLVKPDGTIIEYERWGGNKTKGIHVEDKDFYLGVESTDSEGINELLKMIYEAGLKAGTAGVAL